jgi:hypothetical protein
MLTGGKKRQDLQITVHVSDASTKELYIQLEGTGRDEINQETVIVMDGTYYVSSSVVKATARRENHVTVCKYTRQEVAQ